MWKELLVLPGLAVAAALALEKPFGDSTGWTLSGEAVAGNDVIMLARDRASKGSIWLNNKVPYAEWTVEATVRAFKGDTPAENSGLALWFTSDRLAEGPVHGSSDSWDGLALMLDSLGWDEHGLDKDMSGALRAHLNDGTIKFKDAVHASEQSFTLCGINYRETGAAAIKIRAGYGRGVFVVTVNDQQCITTDKITLPDGYFGVSASTDDSMDKFAVDSLKVYEGIGDDLLERAASLLTKTATPRVGDSVRVQPPAEQVEPAHGQGQAQSQLGSSDVLSKLAELETKLQNVENAQKDVSDRTQKLGDLQAQINLAADSHVEPIDSTRRDLAELNSRVDKVAQDLSGLQRSVQDLTNAVGSLASSKEDTVLSSEIQKIKSQIGHITTAVDSHRQTVTETLSSRPEPSQGASLIMVVVVVIISQVVFYICYNAYLTRKNRHLKLL